MNLLQLWEKKHFEKILNELATVGIELKIENAPLIIEETSFKIRSKKYPNKCPYYLKRNSCHPQIKELNCFLCACPQYKSELLTGGCKINSKKGFFYLHKNLPHGKVWDCSECYACHHPRAVERFLKDNMKILRNFNDGNEKPRFVLDKQKF